MSQYIEFTSGEDIFTITIQRPEKRNAMTMSMWEAVTAGINQAVTQDMRAVVLTGTGDFFCAGDDITALVDIDTGRDARKLAETLLECWTTIEQAPIPVIGRANGSAYGGGFETLLATDIAIVPQTARLQLSEVRIGAYPFYAAKRLAQITSKQRAMDLAVLAREITGQTAADWGLLARAVPQSELDAEVTTVIEHLRKGAPESITATKQWLTGTLQTPGENIGMATGLGHLFAGEDAMEGAQAFIENRSPEFQG